MSSVNGKYMKNIRGAVNPLATPHLKRTSLLYAVDLSLSSFRGKHQTYRRIKIPVVKIRVG